MIYNQLAAKKIKVFIASTLLLFSSSSVFALGHLSKETGVINIGQDTLVQHGKNINLGKSVLRASPKFAYAELLYQRMYGEDKFTANGKNLSETIKKSITQVKYRDEALELLGADGWELASTVIREINSGFEIFYYFKKKMD